MSYYAICVGIDDYDNVPEGWDSLEFASKDAKALAELLNDPSQGGFDRVEVLTAPAQTTLSGIIDALKRLFYEIRPGPEDTVILYFACHCGIDQQDRLYLIPSDGRINEWGIPDLGTMLRLESLAAYFAGSQAHNLVLLLDLAYAEENTNLARRIRLTESPNFFTAGSVISSSIIDELHMLRHSPLSYCLLKALKQPPAPNGWVTIQMLQDFITDKLRQVLDIYWATHSQLLNQASPFMDDVPLVRAVPESEEFTREVKTMLLRCGYRLLNTGKLDMGAMHRVRAEITVAFTRSVVEVLALDNSRVNWSVQQAQKFMESLDRLRMQGEITHGLVVCNRELDPTMESTLRRWRLEFVTMQDALAQV